MSVKFLNQLITIFFITFLTSAVGCQAKEPDENIKVSWGKGYTLPELLASPVALNEISDLNKLLDAHWYTDLSMMNTKEGDSIFKSCRDYFDQAVGSTRTIKEFEMGQYLEFKVMCEATRIMQLAKEPKFNFLPVSVLTESLPTVLPKAVALQASLTESDRSDENTALVYWSDITPITKYESQSSVKSTYYHEGGYQEFEIAGNGDTNNDNVQDVLVVVRDYLEGGNYFNIRLLLLSVDKDNNWELIEEL